MTGPGAPSDNVVEAEGQKFSFLFLGGTAPEPKVQGGHVLVGDQIVGLENGQITLVK